MDVPFINKKFFAALTDSGCVGEGTGWDPLFFHDEDSSFSYLFKKKHSYGEYIFDWAWAQAFEQNGYLYYPKLTSMIPFTPATVPHFVNSSKDEVIVQEMRREHFKKHRKVYEEGEYSSLHYLFITKDEKEFFEKEGLFIRESFQYHFSNNGYVVFDDFLKDLKGRKAKQIKKERMISNDIKIESLTGDSLSSDHALEMWDFYQSTIRYKGSIAYLNKDFFLSIFTTMKEHILYVRAALNDKAVAGSLYFFDDECLYGRYWGCHQEVKNLHFELCYYRGIDFCLENKLARFEAGAQGEHKIARGFRPTITYSAHHIKSEMFSKVIIDFTVREKKGIRQYFAELNESLPFRKSLQ